MLFLEMFENTKAGMRIRKPKKDRKHNDPRKGQQDKQPSTKHCT